MFPGKKWILPGGIFPAPALGAVTGGRYVADFLDSRAPVLATRPGQYVSWIARVTSDMRARGSSPDRSMVRSAPARPVSDGGGRFHLRPGQARAHSAWR